VQISRPNFVSNLLTRLELSYSSLRIDTYVIFGLIALVIAVMCGGAYQDAVRQASAYLSVTTQQDPTMMSVVNLVNQYGLALLIAICYLSNITKSGRRRELLVDAITVAIGFFLPQLTFHSTWLYVTHEIVAAQGMMVNSAVVTAINIEWLIVLGTTVLLLILAQHTWRIARRRS
jgi:hypothetical protein